MVRISKQSERRSKFPRRRRPPALKTGAKKEALAGGFKVHRNGIEEELLALKVFIPRKIG